MLYEYKIIIFDLINLIYKLKNFYMAQEGGTPIRVKLITDLTKYDSKLTIGQEGFTVPNEKYSMWGDFDGFVAVNFDCDSKMDIALNSLEIIK